ncbi:hypothetical protein [Candidatus Methylobacter oryzae]|uniref:DUF4276 family protein n=1 Tax=Candidatus Methylobacter oryzae TaxID=2497749 RepID=A0ABY3C8G5_9GAMM|nr:hypothetical protein [Candidatus Methylobacter oryzae]TRW92889.1 hypothetical protein EKO24_014110 [Candidatus Methylobacter oryzae]
MAINLNGYRITVLCEDIAQYDFICAYAKLLGADNKITKLPAYNNDTVLKLYAKAVSSYRKYATQNIILIAMIDADEKTVNERLRSFDRVLDEEKYRLNQPTRLPNEKILLFVPIRNIESWFYYVDKGNTNGETLKGSDGKLISYKNQYANKDVSVFAKKLKEEICVNSLPENAPSSLHHACNELKRLNN